MNRKAVANILVALFFVALAGWFFLHRLTAAPPSLTPGEAEQLLARDPSAISLDVRTADEYRGPLGHLRGSLLIPLQELESRIGELDTLRLRTIVVYCRGGSRSATAATLLNNNGYTAFTMTGGILRWTEEHRHVEMESHQ
jgi:rhodanese-related sulfurtransferase